MKLACISDSHIGYRHRFKTQRLRDYVTAFNDAVKKALARKPDIIVFGGDLLHHSKPDPVSLRTVMKKLIELAGRMPVIVSIGNHEIEGHLGTTYTPIYSDIHENIHVLTSENPHVKIKVRGKEINFHGFEYTRSRERAEETLFKISSELKSRGVNILLLHQAVEHYLSPHELSISALREVASKYDLILLGHVHKHQEVAEVMDLTPCYYIGSTERISFNEASNKTGFMFLKDDYRKPDYVKVKSASMKHVTEKPGKITPEEANRRIEELINSNKDVKILKLELEADIQGDLTEVRRDWSAVEDDFTILEVNVIQPAAAEELRFERMNVDENTVREYFRKTGIQDKELEDLCIELYNKYSAG
jgi:DNA repair exonuclease SbcCD nuclease subunit